MKKSGEPFRQGGPGNSEVWRRFLDGLGMHGLEWSRNTVLAEVEGRMDTEQYVSILEDRGEYYHSTG